MTPEELFNSNEFALEIENYCRGDRLPVNEDKLLESLGNKFGERFISHLSLDYCYAEFLNKFDNEYDSIGDIKVAPTKTIQEQFMIYTMDLNNSCIIDDISLLAKSSKRYYYFEKFDDINYILWKTYIEPKDQDFYFQINAEEGFNFTRMRGIDKEKLNKKYLNSAFRFDIPLLSEKNGQTFNASFYCNQGVACKELDKEILYLDTKLMKEFNNIVEAPWNRFFQFGVIMDEQDTKNLLGLLTDRRLSSIMKDEVSDYIKLVNK